MVSIARLLVHPSRPQELCRVQPGFALRFVRSERGRPLIHKEPVEKSGHSENHQCRSCKGGWITQRNDGSHSLFPATIHTALFLCRKPPAHSLLLPMK